MNFLSVRTRLAFGLSSLVVSVLLLAMLAGVVPDESEAKRFGRARLCEAVALQASRLADDKNLARAEASLQVLVDRNDELLSAAIRDAKGQILLESGHHANYWQSHSNNASTEDQIHVPIRSKNEKWGQVEFCFTPMNPPGIRGVIQNSWLQMLVFTGVVSFVVFTVYLRAMLRHLDPSQAVPGRVRSAFDTLAEGLVVLDKQGRIVLANRMFSQCTGHEPESLIGNPLKSFPWQEKEGNSILDTPPWDLVLQSQEPPTSVMLGLIDAQGIERSFLINCAPVYGDENSVRGVLVSFEDVTQIEQKKVELAESKLVAETANRAKSEFLANMSHEIRTPMNAILGFADILRRGYAQCDSERQEYLNTIHSSGKHLLHLINDILDLSKVESGRMELEMADCSPHQIISNTVKILDGRANEKQLSLNYTIEGQLPATIRTDSVRFQQVLTNLIGNAIKFTETGGIRIVARLQKDISPVRFIVEIIDTGIGMSQETLDRIFDPFTQAESSITRRFGGTGLGLSISRQFVEVMGGELTVQSQIGKGSTFTVSLDPGPMENVELLNQTQLTVQQIESVTTSTSPVQLPSAKVLLVDDGEENRKLIELVLKRAGLQVETAENGQLAVEKANQSDYDLIFMDMQMPVMDGYTATSTLRKQGHTLPIVALTANAMHGDEEKCRQAGCTGFLPKPVDLDALTDLLAETLAPDSRSSALGKTESKEAVTSKDDFPELIDKCLNEMAVALVEENYQMLFDSAEKLAETACRFGHNELLLPVQELAEAARRKDYEMVESMLVTLNNYRRSSSPTPTSSTVDLDGTLVCSLPLDDEEFMEIAMGFSEQLPRKFQRMQAAWESRDFAELVRFAHWLKGAGGTVGFPQFHDPARELEQAAKNQDEATIPLAISALMQLAGRIQIPQSVGDQQST